MCLLLALSYTKFDDLVRDKCSLKYLEKKMNIVLVYR